jgi:proteasome lid subunit RPN8/RPN11
VPQIVEISPEHRAQLRRVLDQSYPRECCGLLLGNINGNRVCVTTIVSVRNTATSVGAFSIPDHEIRRARLVSSQRREAIVAVFHSHPHGVTALSDADRRTFEFSEWPWIVITEGETADDIDLGYHEIPTSRD